MVLQAIVRLRSYIPTHGADTEAVFLQDKPINNDSKIQVLGSDGWTAPQGFRPFIARFPIEDWPIWVGFIGWIAEIGWGKSIEDMRNLGVMILVRERCVNGRNVPSQKSGRKW